MLATSVASNPSGVVTRAHIVFGTPQGLDEEYEEPELLEQEYTELESEFEQEMYKYSEFNRNVRKLVKKMRKLDQKDRRIQKCCEMLVHNALIAQEWVWLFNPLDHLMRCYRAKGVRVKREYVAYWILSLLMRTGRTVVVRRYNSLELHLSGLPRQFMRWKGVQQSLGVCRVLLANNHVGFFEI